MLRKSGVATKAKPKKTKAGSQSTLPPPTPREVKKRATKRIAPEKQRSKSGRRFENSGSESEDSDNWRNNQPRRHQQQLHKHNQRQ